MKRYYVIEHPTPEQWRSLLTWALSRAQRIEFAHVDDRAKSLPNTLRPFEDRITEAFTTCYYWGNRQVKPRRFYRLALNEALSDLLLASSSPAEWCAPSSELEDPALYQDDVPILWTIAHDNMVFLWIEDSELAQWRAQNMPVTQAPDTAPPIVREDVLCQRRSVGDKIMMLIAILIVLSFCGMAYYMIAALFAAFGG